MGLFTDKEGDEDLAADWAAIREKHTVDEVETPEKEPVAALVPDKEPEVQTEPKDTPGKDRVRDESGKFVKGEKPKEAPKEQKVLESPSDPQASPVPSDARAPSSWKPTARAEWEKLSPTVKAEIVRREQDHWAGVEKLKGDAQFGQSLRGVIEPYRMLIQAEGGTPEKAVESLLRTAAIFRVGTPQQKAQAVAGICQQYGVDLNQLSGQQSTQQQQPQQFRDPRVDQMLRQQQEYAKQQEETEQRQMESVVAKWMGEVDEKGESKRPYLQDVISEMAVMIPELKRSNPTLTHQGALEQAYERAVWAHPETRQLLQAKVASDLEAKRRAESQSRTAAARRAASVNVPRRASLPGPGTPGKLEDTIAEEARRLGLVS